MYSGSPKEDYHDRFLLVSFFDPLILAGFSLAGLQSTIEAGAESWFLCFEW